MEKIIPAFLGVKNTLIFLWVVILGALVTGCLYQPLYGSAPTGFSSTKATRITIPEARTRVEQITRNAIYDELAKSGIRAKHPHALKFKVKKTKVPFALRSDESPTRYDITLRVGFQLFKDGSKKPLFEANNRARASYDVVTSDFANISSENAATKRAAALVARQIATRLGVLFRKQ